MNEVDALIRRVRAGETEAYAEIIRRHERDAWRVVAAMLQDFELARELLQRVFVDAYTKLGQYRLGTDFTAWLKTIARNLVRQELRRLAREQKHLRVYKESLEERWRQEEAASRYDERYHEALARCREHLPRQSAQLIQWRYEEGLSFEQIAQAMETTSGAIEKALSRLRIALRQCMEQRLAES